MDESLAARSLINVLPESRWLGVSAARAFLAIKRGADSEVVARKLFEDGAFTLRRAREIVPTLELKGFLHLIPERQKTGSAENPVTKLFPAAVTEHHFLEAIDSLHAAKPALTYTDQRFASHSLVDFSLHEGTTTVPVNVKNAGTRFENAKKLVDLDPDDCVPIPAYKAFEAIEKEPNLVYIIAIDYSLVGRIKKHLIPLMTVEERLVWNLLNEYYGKYVRDAEDRFVYSIVAQHWDQFSQHHRTPDFRVISARKAIRILKTLPKRTPGIGLRAWGTGARAEVNVHIDVSTETKPWSEVNQRILRGGLENIITAINRKRTEIVDDPEI